MSAILVRYCVLCSQAITSDIWLRYMLLCSFILFYTTLTTVLLCLCGQPTQILRFSFVADPRCSPSSFYELEVFVGPLFFLFFYRQATMYCLKMIFMENCQFLQSCSTYGPCSNIRLKIPLYGITLYYFYHYYYFYYFIISLWRMYQVARILSWMHVHNCFMKLKMILWIKSDFKCYEKLSFS
jgi:hypothetical protein